MNIIKKETTYAGRKLTLETGELAILANMSVKATYGDTVLLVTVVSGDANPEIDFFPLTVNYDERLYASGLIKSSRFVKRDGRPTDDAVIIKRLIDHAIRPLFPHDYMDEVQIIVTVLSLDEDSDPEVLAMIATSAALMASNIPWNGPMMTARVGHVEDKYVLNPTRDQVRDKSELDMIVSFVGEDKKFLAVEAEADILPEEKILGAIEFAKSGVDEAYKVIMDFAAEVNPKGEKYEYVSKALDETMFKEISDIAKPKIDEQIKMGFDKVKSKVAEEAIRDEILTTFDGKYKKADMMMALEELEKKAMQHLILDEGKRPDGRDIDEIREITSKVGILPRTHGSGLFTRGVTQVLTVATLGSPSLELLVQNMYGEESKRYIHYYNFPPFSNGEVGRVGVPKSRDVGHGMLAEKALRAVLPSQKDFPYMILLVSETLSSSGSSSMAATCGSTLALMDAGVPIKAPVAGIGVGIIVNDDFSKFKILTDLAYKEDAFGFLDFKMTGTREGVTAIQSDMKLAGIPTDIMPEIIKQSKDARMKVLDKMEQVISKPRAEVSERAPKMSTTTIDPSKIGLVIGSGGKNIKELQEVTETEIFIDDDGSIVVTGLSKENTDKAVSLIDGMTRDIERGEIYDGVVKEILDFGALVEILPGKVGLLHVSEILNTYVERVEDHLHIGDTVKVKVLDVGNDGKIGLSKRALEPGYDEEGANQKRMERRNSGGGGRGGFGGRREGRRPHR